MAEQRKLRKDEAPETDEQKPVPQTALGARLLELRERIVASGEPLLDWEDLEKEVAERRGGAGPWR